MNKDRAQIQFTTQIQFTAPEAMAILAAVEVVLDHAPSGEEPAWLEGQAVLRRVQEKLRAWWKTQQ